MGLEVGRTVRATAPVRVGDVGGWTDTWFGSPGRVCHLAVGPAVTVDVEVQRRDGGIGGDSGDVSVRLSSPSLGEPDYDVGPSTGSGWATPVPGRHPLLEHAIGAVLAMAEIPADLGLAVRITSAVPPGASLGTSASVVVALIGALDALVGGGERSADQVARLAHEVETTRAGRQAGVQDQWAAAMGGCGLLAIGPYPEVRHSAVPLAADTAAELGERLVTVVFGPHDSSAVHAQVINDVVGCSGPDHDRARGALRRLSTLAGDAAAALADGDIDRWAAVLTDSTEAQRHLHPALVGPAHESAIERGRSSGAAGWKVNGAGGDGGSLTLVAAPGGAEVLRAALQAVDPSWQLVDLRPSAAGLEVEVR